MKITFNQFKNKTTDPKKLLERILHISSNELDLLLGKTARNAPLEPEEIRKLETISKIVTSAISTQISVEKHEANLEENPEPIKISQEQLKALAEKAGQK
jgi:hypothetical protein